MSNYPPPATHAEWIRLVAAGRYATFDMRAGHHVKVAEPGLIQARCTCGWVGPDRTHDEPAALLVIDDVDWHMERVAADGRAMAAQLALGKSRGWDR